jgi:type VI secretion system protein ImpF
MSASRAGIQDRVQPALLDLLTDDRPQEQAEADASSSLSPGRLREIILRDLSWLLNTSQMGTTIDLAPYPEVAASTLNYGVRARTGWEVGGIDPSALRHEILLSLRRFEPRLLPQSVEVTVTEDRRDGSLQFKIVADLWAQPAPLRMIMRTEAGETTGAVRVVELRSEVG